MGKSGNPKKNKLPSCIHCRIKPIMHRTSVWCKPCTLKARKKQQKNYVSAQSSVPNIRVKTVTASASSLNHVFFDTMSIGDRVVTRKEYLNTLLRELNK